MNPFPTAGLVLVLIGIGFLVAAVLSKDEDDEP